MASISKRVSKKNITTWQVIIRRPGEKTITATHGTFELAKEFANSVEAAFAKAAEKNKDPFSTLPASGDWGDEELATTFDLFAASKKCIPGHRAVLSTLKKHVGNTTIRELDQDWIEDYFASMRKTNSSRGRPYKLATLVRHMVMVNTV